ncbi:MAG: ComEC/Rec2 family competence protein [Acutalibacteraceae bacterium]
MAKRASKKDKRVIYIILAIAVLAVAFSRLAPETWDSLFEKTGVNDSVVTDAALTVSFIDVGQGDCTLFYSPDNGVILVDSGEADKAQTVINYLNSLGIETIDYCVMTHPHSDHMGSMAQIMSKFNIENLIIPELSEINIPTTKTYENFLLSAEENADEIIPAQAGTTYSVGDIALSVLGPISQNEDLNNMSVVVKVEYKEASFLITGDCSFDEEDELMENDYNALESDVIKIGHHGSAGATSADWLEAVNPQIGVISVGNGNSYGHPTKTVLGRLDDFDVEYYRTDVVGTVVIETDGKAISVQKKAA